MIKKSIRINKNLLFDLLIMGGLIKLSNKNGKEYVNKCLKINLESKKIDNSDPIISINDNKDNNNCLEIKHLILPKVSNDVNIYYDIKKAEKEGSKDLDEITLEINTYNNNENTENNNDIISIYSESEYNSKIKKRTIKEKWKRPKAKKWILTFKGIVCKTKEEKKELFEKIKNKIISRGFQINKYLVVDDGKNTFTYIKLNKPFNYNKISKKTMFNLNNMHPHIETTFNLNKLLPLCNEEDELYSNLDIEYERKKIREITYY